MTEQKLAKCSMCEWHKAGGQPCYFHSSKFGFGKLSSSIQHVAEAIVIELKESVDEELKEWP